MSAIATRITIDRNKYDWLLYPLLIFLVTRTLVFVASYIAVVGLQEGNLAQFLRTIPQNIFSNMWVRYDAEWYLSISTYGYWFDKAQPTNAVFFPMLPILIRLVTPLVGSGAIAGIVISHCSLLGALIFLYRLTEFEFHDRAAARRAVLYISIFPTAFFFSSIYTESLFLLVTVAAVYFARLRLWAWSALFGLIASATRVTGILIWGLVVLEWLRFQGWTFGGLYDKEAWRSLLRGLRTNWVSLLFICCIPLGLLSLMIFLKSQFGDPFVFASGQANWGRINVGVLNVTLTDLRVLLNQDYRQGASYWYVAINMVSFLSFLALAVVVWRRLGDGYGLFVVLSLLIAALSSTFSMARFALVLFPVFMILAVWGKRPILDKIITVGFTVLCGVLLTLFVNWGLIA